jgi:hypothetical protein
MEFGPGYARYALRYWMLDPQADDPTDSAVRVHLLAALQRGGMQLAVPEQSLLVTKENEAYRKSIQRRETERRVADLRRFELFSGLQEDELRTISEHLIFAPFASGDVIYPAGRRGPLALSADRRRGRRVDADSRTAAAALPHHSRPAAPSASAA